MMGMKANVSVSAKENDIQHKLQSKSNQTQSAAAKVKTPAGLAFYPTAITQSHAFGFKGKKRVDFSLLNKRGHLGVCSTLFIHSSVVEPV